MKLTKTKILILFLLCLSLVACSNEEKTIQDENKKEQEIETGEKEDLVEEDSKLEEAENEKIYKVGEEAMFKDENGKEMYSLRIDSVKSADKYIAKNNNSYEINGSVGIFSGEYKQVVEVIYTYTNIAKDDESLLYIAPEDLQVADIKGNIGEVTVIPLKKRPQTIIPDTSSSVEGHYALSNKSDEIKIIFSSEMYSKTIIFKAAVELEEL